VPGGRLNRGASNSRESGAPAPQLVKKGRTKKVISKNRGDSWTRCFMVVSLGEMKRNSNKSDNFYNRGVSVLLFIDDNIFKKNEP
jgi:hypothetical protein